MFCLCFVCVSLVFFNVCQNPKILFSQNKILDFCLTQVLRKQNVCQTYVKHVGDISFTLAAGLYQVWISNWQLLDTGGRPTHVSHTLQISHTCFALCVTYVWIIFHLCVVCVHICFVLCLTYVSYTFHICFVYVSHMFLLTPRHSLCLRHAPSTLYRNHPWSPFGSS